VGPLEVYVFPTKVAAGPRSTWHQTATTGERQASPAARVTKVGGDDTS
jgi:hypothetical protein